MLYEVITKFSSGDLDYRTRLGLLYLDRDRYDDAIDEFLFVLEAKPENSRVRFFLGTAYEEKGLLPEAEKDRITSYNVCYTKLLRCWQASRTGRDLRD